MTALPFWAPLALLGFAPWMILLQLSISLIYQFWIHTERVDRLPAPVEFVFNTPSHHRVHHGANEVYLDRNYGGILIVWDRIFGTFQGETERPPLRADQEHPQLPPDPRRLPRVRRPCPRRARSDELARPARLRLPRAGLVARRQQRRDSRLTMAPWKLPLIVAAIAVPIVAGFLVGGGGGLAVGTVSVFAILIYAVRERPRGPIASAPAKDGGRHVLIVAATAVEDPADVARVADAVGLDGSREQPEVLVLVPARIGFLDRWASDVESARHRAQERLVATVAALAKAGVAAEARVGDEDVVQAIEDQLQSFPATEVVLVSGERERGRRCGGGARARACRPSSARCESSQTAPAERRVAQQTWACAALRTTWKALPGMRFS